MNEVKPQEEKAIKTSKALCRIRKTGWRAQSAFITDEQLSPQINNKKKQLHFYSKLSTSYWTIWLLIRLQSSSNSCLLLGERKLRTTVAAYRTVWKVEGKFPPHRNNAKTGEIVRKMRHKYLCLLEFAPNNDSKKLQIKWGNREWSVPRAPLEPQLFKRGRRYRHLLWYRDSHSGYTLVNPNPLLVVIFHKDKVVFRAAWGIIAELAKIGATTGISVTLEAGKLCLCTGACVSGSGARSFREFFDPVPGPFPFPCAWCQEDSLTQKGFWLIKAL